MKTQLKADPQSRIYLKGVKYTINVSPNDMVQGTDDLLGDDTPNTRLNRVYEMVSKDIISPACLYAQMALYPEFSVPEVYYNQPGKNGGKKYSRIHFHGWIKFTQPLAWLENCSHLFHNYRIEIDTIEDEDYWIKYYTKDKYCMADYCRNRQLSYPLTSSVKKLKKKPSKKKTILTL